MENRSNVIFDINGRHREYFDLALQLAIAPNDGKKYSTKVCAWYVDEEKNRMVLLWHHQPNSNAFITPLTAAEVSPQVWAWLENRQPSKPPMDHDGDSVIGWRMYVDNMWGHVEPFSSYAIVAIEPSWIEYGK